MRKGRQRSHIALRTAIYPISLATLIEAGMPLDELQGFLNEFRCSRDADVTHFLRHHAIEYEIEGRTVTHLYLDGSTNAVLDFQINRSLEGFALAGFFSVATRPVPIDERVGQGASGLLGILIAEIARNDLFSDKSFDGRIILADAEVIALSMIPAGEKMPVILECKDNEKLLGYYQGNGYRPLDGDVRSEYNRLYKVLQG